VRVFDLHVHTGPCVVARRNDDVGTVALYEAAGFSGCVLKAHCESTVGRAAAAGAGRSMAVHGGIVLNRTVGGLNPVAVSASLAMGGRVVWLPTVDARHHRASGLAHPPSCAPDLPAGPGYAAPPVDPTAESPLRAIFSLIADADAVLATGHLSEEEVAWVVPAARRAGVRRVLLTHPSFTVPAMTAAATRALVEQGAVAEITAYQLLHQDEADPARLAAFVREVGPRYCVLSSDAGQLTSPTPPEALHRLIDALAGEGLDRGLLEAMAGEAPATLVTP
jgi:hypothetical protein